MRKIRYFIFLDKINMIQDTQVILKQFELQKMMISAPLLNYFSYTDPMKNFLVNREIIYRFTILLKMSSSSVSALLDYFFIIYFFVAVYRDSYSYAECYLNFLIESMHVYSQKILVQIQALKDTEI